MTIANHPDIRERMSRAAVEATIATHADTELRYDTPYEDATRVRVANSFTAGPPWRGTPPVAGLASMCIFNVDTPSSASGHRAMRVAVRKWGNSLALRIPKALAVDAKIESGTEVDVSLEEGRLIVTAVPAGPSLHDLLAAITPENTHAEVRAGKRAEREAW